MSNNIFLFPRVTSNVTKMNGIFYGATKFNSDISRWYSNNIKNLMISISIPDQASEALDNLDAPSSNPAAGNFCSFFFLFKSFLACRLTFFSFLSAYFYQGNLKGDYNECDVLCLFNVY